MVQQACIALAAAVLLNLAWQDFRQRRLANSWIAVHALTFLPYAFASGLTWPEWGWHIATALATFAVTFLFFALGWLGGGDVKLWSSVMLWAGPALALPALVVATFCGGVLGVVCWVAGKLAPRYQHTVLRDPMRLLSAERGVPYGVALAVAGLLVLWVRH